jgi:WD40 repeat protein
MLFVVWFLPNYTRAELPSDRHLDGTRVEWKARDHRIDQVAISPDGTMLLCCSGPDYVGLWNIEQQMQVFRLAMDDVHAVGFFPDGLRAWVLAGSLKIFDTRTGRTIHLIEPRRGRDFTEAALSPDGSLMAAAQESRDHEGHIRLWDTGSWREMKPVEATNVLSIAVRSDNGTIAVGEYAYVGSESSRSVSGEVRVVDLASGTVASAPTGGPVNEVWFGVSNSSLYYMTSDRQVQYSYRVNRSDPCTVIEADPKSLAVKKQVRLSQGGFVAFSPDRNRIVSTQGMISKSIPRGPMRGVARVWDWKTGEELGSLELDQTSLGYPCIDLPRERIAFACNDGLVRIVTLKGTLRKDEP